MISAAVFVLIIGFVIETAIDVICLNDVDECAGIGIFHFFDQKLGFLSGDHRVQESQIILAVAAFSGKLCGAVVSEILDLCIDLFRMSGDNEKRVLFVSLVKHLYGLSTGKLENNGIKSCIPAKQKTGDGQHHCVPH